jgi:hypothetical protein
MHLSAQELIYLRSVARMKWYSATPFWFDDISIGLIQKKLLRAVVGHGLQWELTSDGRSAIQQPRHILGGGDSVDG